MALLPGGTQGPVLCVLWKSSPTGTNRWNMQYHLNNTLPELRLNWSDMCVSAWLFLAWENHGGLPRSHLSHFTVSVVSGTRHGMWVGWGHACVYIMWESDQGRIQDLGKGGGGRDGSEWCTSSALRCAPLCPGGVHLFCRWRVGGGACPWIRACRLCKQVAGLFRRYRHLTLELLVSLLVYVSETHL